MGARADRPRYLGRTHAYSDRPTVDALECVDHDEQQRQTRQVTLARERQQQEAWRATHAGIDRALDWFRDTSGPIDGPTTRALRHVEHAVRRVDARLGL